jgi:hypothetical protein
VVRVAIGVIGKVGEWRRRRDLSARERAGRYSRSLGWYKIGDFAAQWWWMLILLPAAFVLAFLVIALRAHGVVRGAVLGGSAISGLWFDVLIVLVWTGAGSQFMGASGEASTSDVLRGLGRDGWRLVNNVKLTSWGDIDHVMVGPGGVLVVESKWSAESWPVNGYGPRSMESRKKNAAGQVQRNAKDVVDWLRESGIEAPVMSVAVLWTGARRSGSGWEQWRNKTTILVHGTSLRDWLRTELPTEGVKAETVERIYSMLGEKVDEQDQEAIDAGQTVPPTFRSLMINWAMKPMVGLILGAYAIWLMHFAYDWRVAFATSAAATGLGLWAVQFKPIRGIAIGWTVPTFMFVLAMVFILIHGLVQ